MLSDASFQRLHVAASVRGVDLSAFRPEFLARRLKRSAILAGALFVDREVDRLLGSPTELAQFLDDLSVGVSGFFRDALPFALLEDRVLPRLKRTFASLNVWSAACAQGNEAWSLAMLLSERDVPFSLWASDRNPGFIRGATEGVFAQSELMELTRRRYAAYFEPVDAERARIREALRKQVRFEVHDLARGVLPAFGDEPLHLVLCRNVLIYLSAEARTRICLEIAERLAPGGCLLLGTAEHLPAGVPLVAIDEEARLFRREAP